MIPGDGRFTSSGSVFGFVGLDWGGLETARVLLQQKWGMAEKLKENGRFPAHPLRETAVYLSYSLITFIFVYSNLTSFIGACVYRG